MKLRQIRISGYKNLIDCSVDLGDFNVLVGPNNSGKSNLLEAIQMLWPICFGDENLRNVILMGMPVPSRLCPSSLCHLEEHRNKPLKIGVSFEVQLDEQSWAVDYDVHVQCGESDIENVGFLYEKLTAKVPGRPGPVTTYILREKVQGKEVMNVKVNRKGILKEHPISKRIPSIQAISSLYPDFKGLPEELTIFIEMIRSIGTTKVFAISPKGMREKINKEEMIEGICTTSFDLLYVLDQIKEDGEYFEVFKESLCDILDFEQVYFETQDVSAVAKDKKPSKATKRVRMFAVKRTGSEPSFIEEYSDGTLVVIAVLEALFSENSLKGPILCLEELENCLHPEAVDKLLCFLQDNSDRWPVLITTHSPYLLNGVKPTDVNVAVVDETGATHFEKVKNTRQLREYLSKSLMSFGDLLVNNYERFRE